MTSIYLIVGYLIDFIKINYLALITFQKHLTYLAAVDTQFLWLQTRAYTCLPFSGGGFLCSKLLDQSQVVSKSSYLCMQRAIMTQLLNRELSSGG